MTIQDDGKIVVAGNKYTNDGPFDHDTDFAIARYNPNGSLDTSFDGDGRATAGLGASDTAYGVALQADGRIVLAGESDDFDGDSDLALARYNHDGSLDSSFDGDGKLTTGLGADDHAFDVAIEDGFYPVVAGRSDVGGEYDFALARYNPDGSLDSTFAGDGKLTAGIGGIDSAEDVAIQSDGRIVAAGWSSHSGDVDFALARFTPSGAFDGSFSGNGKLLTDFGQDDAALAIAIQPNGRIVAAGTSGTIDRPEFYPFAERFALTRYHGVADNTPPGTVIDSGPVRHDNRLHSDLRLPLDRAGVDVPVRDRRRELRELRVPADDRAARGRRPHLPRTGHRPGGNVDPTTAARSFTVQTSSFQPDGRIRLEGDAAYIGDNVYNLTGDFQTCATTARRGETRVYYLRAQNDGTATDTIRLRGCVGDPGFSVRYFNGSTEITSQVAAGTYEFAGLAPQASGTIRLEIGVQSSAVIGAIETCRVTATSASAPTRADQVRARVDVVA